ncbi:MAG: PorT family protein [Pedobacter sp.]|nr:MAG: PorT family protein [Pedobacter sp.]
MKKLILASVLFLAGTAVKAQQVSLIPKAGINISKQAIQDIDGEKMKVGFQGGVGFNIATGKNFSVQPELNYISKGTKFEAGNINRKLNLNYLEIPVLAKYSFGPAYVNAGPSIGLLISKKDEVRQNYGTELKKLDFGVQMGAGLALPLGIGKVIVDGRYALGLSELSKNVNVKNRGIIASLGYSIPLK